MIGDLLAVFSVLAVVASLLFSAMQTREVARQSRVSNAVGQTSALVDLNALIHHWHTNLLAHPDLRPYFHEGKECAADNPHRAELLVLSEQLLDIMECNLHVTEMMPGVTYFESWHVWPRFMLDNGPILREMLHMHPDWWPGLFLICPSGTDPATGQPRLPIDGHPLVRPRRPARRLLPGGRRQDA